MHMQSGSRLLAAVALTAAASLAQEHDHAKMMAQPDHFEHRFDNAEELAKSFDDPARDAWQMPDRVIAALKLTAGQSVSDIGAGTGYFSARLAKSNPRVQVYAVDIEPSMVGYLKSRAVKEGLANVTPIQAAADATNLPASVDMALIVDTFHHIPNRLEYFRKLARQLKPGGRVAIIDFHEDSPTGPPKEFRFTAERIREELAAAGFRQTEKLDFLPNQHFLIFTYRGAVSGLIAH
jgi:ubiquinone/menaquinone biosynthesis C-methylase UbiE